MTQGTTWQLHGRGFRYDTINGGEFVPILDEKGQWIADVRTAPGGNYRAWADLIATAPQLLAACEAVKTGCLATGGIVTPSISILLDQVIAKATGGAA